MGSGTNPAGRRDCRRGARRWRTARGAPVWCATSWSRLTGQVNGSRPAGSVLPSRTSAAATPAWSPPYQASSTDLTLSSQGMAIGCPDCRTTMVLGLTAATSLISWSWPSGSGVDRSPRAGVPGEHDRGLGVARCGDGGVVIGLLLLRGDPVQPHLNRAAGDVGGIGHLQRVRAGGQMQERPVVRQAVGGGGRSTRRRWDGRRRSAGGPKPAPTVVMVLPSTDSVAVAPSAWMLSQYSPVLGTVRVPVQVSVRRAAAGCRC